MKLKCIKKTDGFTLNKKYKLLGVGGEMVQLKNDAGEVVVLYEGYFE